MFIILHSCIVYFYIILAIICQSVNAFTSTKTTNINNIFLQTPKINRKDGTRLGIVPVVDLIPDHILLQQQQSNSIKNTISTSNSILISNSAVGTYNRNSYPIGRSIHPTVNDYATRALPSGTSKSSYLGESKKESSSSTTASDRGFKILGVSSDPYNLASAPEYLKSPETKKAKIVNPKVYEFYALELDFLPKLPVAAAIYVAFEFFFMNKKRQIELEENENNEGLYYDDEEEEAREVSKFWTVVGLRTFAAFTLTFLSFFVSKMDLTQVDSMIR